MTREQAIERLTKAKALDTEAAHYEADMVLCQLLISLGYQDVVDEYAEINKRYA